MTELTKQFSDAPSASDKPAPTRTMGAPGAVVVNGFVIEDERNPDLMDLRQYETYSNLLANVSIVASGVRYFLNLVSKATWKVRAANDSEAAVEMAALVEKQLKRMETSWSRVVRRAAMYRFYGFSIQEWTMEVTENGYEFLDIAPRPQQTIERWEVDSRGKVQGVLQRNPDSQELLPLARWKVVYVVDDSLQDTPTGLGLFRHIVSSCARLQRYEQLEGYAFESDLRGIPIGRAPFAALQEAVDTGLITAEQKKEAEAPLTSFISNHIKNPALGILVDSITYQSLDESSTPSAVRQWDVDLLKGSSTSLPDMAIAIERVNREIARILGVEGLLLGEQTTGSHALSKDKSLNFALIVDSTLNELVDTFQKDIIERFFEVNGYDKKLLPTFDTDALQHRDITQITQALKDIAAAGAKMDPNDPATNEIREMLGLSNQPTIDEKIANELRRKGGSSTVGNQNDSGLGEANPNPEN
jgi:hypothetical protein